MANFIAANSFYQNYADLDANFYKTTQFVFFGKSFLHFLLSKLFVINLTLNLTLLMNIHKTNKIRAKVKAFK